MTSVAPLWFAVVLMAQQPFQALAVECTTTSNQICTITCSAVDDTSCNDQIYLDDTITHVNLVCNGTTACSSLSLTINNTQSVDVQCIGYQSCRLMSILHIGSASGGSSEFNLSCDGDLSCAYGSFVFENPRTVANIDCNNGDNSYSACLDTTISAMPITALTLRCLSTYACWQTAVYAPLLQPDSSLTVSLSRYSVRDLVIYNPDFFSTTFQDRIQIECNEPESADCVIYSGASGVFVMYGERMDHYCRLIPESGCPLLGSADPIEVNFIYADDRSLDTNFGSSEIALIFTTTSMTLSTDIMADHDVVILMALESHDVVYDFSAARDVVLLSNRMQNATIYGPSECFKFLEWLGYSADSTFHLNETSSISVPCLGCPFSSATAGDPYGWARPVSPWTTLRDSQMFVGQSMHVHINCGDQSGKDCDGLQIFSELELSELQSVSLVSEVLWNISCDGQRLGYNRSNGRYYAIGWNCEDMVLHFDGDAQCEFNDTHRCPEYLWTFAPTAAPTVDTMSPSAGPTSDPTAAPSTQSPSMEPTPDCCACESSVSVAGDYSSMLDMSDDFSVVKIEMPAKWVVCVVVMYTLMVLLVVWACYGACSKCKYSERYAKVGKDCDESDNEVMAINEE